MSAAHASPVPALYASAGIAILGEQVVVHGRDLHHDCLDQSYVEYLFFSITGRELGGKAARVFERFWISSAYPDARIWCNRVAGYLGAARVDPALALSAALAATNSVVYGFRALKLAYDVQSAIPEDLEERELWLRAKLAQREVLSGYGRPVHGHDERIGAALQTLADAGVRAGPALKRAHWLGRRLQRDKGIEMNISALWAAVAIDFGITRSEYESFMLLVFAPGYAAVYEDQRSRPPFAFLAGHQTLFR